MTDREYQHWHYRGEPISHLSRYILEEALWRCSKRDRELILSWWDEEKKFQRTTEADARTSHQLYRDLYIIVRDQRNHIANLEAQLLPRLLAEGPVVADDVVQEQLA